jgi:hypothetical protein
MTTEHLLLTTGAIAFCYYWIYLNKPAPTNTTTDEQAELTLDKLITEINQLNTQI